MMSKSLALGVGCGFSSDDARASSMTPLQPGEMATNIVSNIAAAAVYSGKYKRFSAAGAMLRVGVKIYWEFMLELYAAIMGALFGS